MEKGKSSMTSLISSFARAYHSENDNPKIFDDFLAKKLISSQEYNQIAGYMTQGIQSFADENYIDYSSEEENLKWVVQTQLSPTPLARAKYCEDMLENEMRIGCRQYILLGAGMDTFVFRKKDLLEKINIFELDHPATQAFKLERIKKAELEIPETLHYIPVDFKVEDFSKKLLSSKYDKTEKTFFSWLGVSYYLSKENISKLFKTISEMAPKGSAIVFDYADENLFDSKVKRVQNMVGMAKAAGEPMKSCFSYTELEKILEDSGFLIYEHLSHEEIENRFFKNRNDYLHAFEHINYVLAVLK